MFDLAHLKIVRWPVTLAQPDGNDGFVDVTVHVQYERLTSAELAKLHANERGQFVAQISNTLRRVGNGEHIAGEFAAAETALAESDERRLAVLIERIKGWGDQITDGGEPVPFTPDTAAALFAIRPVFDAFWRGLIEASEHARPKISPPSQPGSPAAARS